MNTIYLAGAIDKVSPEFATKWRKKAGDVLRSKNWKVFDPTDGKDLYKPNINTDHYTPEQIVESDLEAIRKSDIVLAEISKKNIPYHGTSMELAYAHTWNKTVYVWGGCKSYWVRYHATRIFDTLDDALQEILATHRNGGGD